MLKFFHSLRFGVRFILVCICAEAILIAILILVGIHTTDRYVKEQIDLRIGTIKHLFGSTLVDPLIRKDYGQLNDMLRAMQGRENIVYLHLTDFSGTEISVGDEQASEEVVHEKIDIQKLGDVYAQLNFGISIHSLGGARRELALKSILNGILIIVASVGVFSLLSLVLTRNLALLEKSAERLGLGDLDVLLKISGNDEMSHLASAFNSMALSLRERMNILVQGNRQAEETLNQLEERIADKSAELYAQAAFQQALFDAVPIPIFARNVKGALLNCNNAHLRFFDVSREDVVGRGIDDLLSEDQAALEAATDREVVLGHTHKTYESAVLTPDGKERRVIVSKTCFFDAAGRVAGIVAAIVDITERIDMEIELRQAKESAEAASVAKSRFLAAASHDLRQPIHAMRLLQSAIEDILDGEDAPDRTEMGELIADMGVNINTVSGLLNSLLDMSRLNAGIIVPVIDDCPLAPVLDNLFRQFDRVAQANGVRLKTISSSSIVRTDGALLARILSNLVANAVKFSANGRVLVGCRHRGQRVEIWVCDNGIGIPADMRVDIFEEFKQIGNDARNKAKGLGLGLAIVRRSADLLGIDIRVSSVLGRGSVFALGLPHQVELDAIRR